MAALQPPAVLHFQCTVGWLRLKDSDESTDDSADNRDSTCLGTRE